MGRADDNLHLADQLLTGLDPRATTLTTRIAALIRDAGTPGDTIPEHADALDAEVRASGVRAARTTLALALCFHHAVLDDPDNQAALATAIRDLAHLTRDRDHAYPRTSYGQTFFCCSFHHASCSEGPHSLSRASLPSDRAASSGMIFFRTRSCAPGPGG
ncbi:hypothetical protein ABZW10_33885 [Kitasatospora sp. NPDC004723]|uniref:hypothetical protein n=1 Tax=Kitasatospora sp. NPDC004723 TaxID=3154288 RepID=UPI0033ACA911